MFTVFFKWLNYEKQTIVLTVSEIQSPPDGYDGHVDINNFWNAVATEMISRGFIPCKSGEKTEQLENSCTESKIY